MDLNRLRYVYTHITFWWTCGIVAGLILGAILRSTIQLSPRNIQVTGFLGQLFLRLMKVVSIPLLATCVTSAIASLDKAISRRLLIQFFICFAVLKIQSSTTALAIAIAISSGISGKDEIRTIKSYTLEDNFFDLARNMFPRNLIEMFVYSHETQLKQNASERNIRLLDLEYVNLKDYVNIIGIMTVSLVAGIAIRTLGPSGDPLLNLIQCLSKFTIVLMKWVLYVAPFCFISLMAKEVMEFPSDSLLKDTGMYVIAACTFYLVQFFIVYPLLYFVFTGNNPLDIYSVDVLLTAAVTGSSLACLPVAADYFENTCHFDKRLVSFVLPLGVSINKDGSAGVYAIASRFVDKWNKTGIGFARYIGFLILSIIASIATPGVPYALLIVLTSVLEGMQLPVDDTIIFYSVEWFGDRLCTLVNVYGTCYILALLQHYNRNLSDSETPEDKETN